MADFRPTFLSQIQHLRSSKRRLSVNATNSIAETKRGSRDSIKRLEDMIALQEDRLDQIGHRSKTARSPHTLRLRVSMKELLLTSMQTLALIKESTRLIETSWMLHES